MAKTKNRKRKSLRGQKHTLKRLSLHPLKAEVAIRAFMRVNPARVEAGMQAMKKRRA